jgi:hypothetical protein
MTVSTDNGNYTMCATQDLVRSPRHKAVYTEKKAKVILMVPSEWMAMTMMGSRVTACRDVLDERSNTICYCSSAVYQMALGGMAVARCDSVMTGFSTRKQRIPYTTHALAADLSSHSIGDISDVRPADQAPT